MTPEELKRQLDAGDDLFVLEVREPHEYQICNLGGHLIPVNELPKRLSELDASREIVVHCKADVAPKPWTSCVSPASPRCTT